MKHNKGKNILSPKLVSIFTFAGTLFVFVFLLYIRIYRLDTIPGVLNGDETSGILHPLQLYYGKLTVFNLTHDGSVPGFVFYRS